MNPWSKYYSRTKAQGADRRSATLQRERRFLKTKLPSSLSYHTAIINGESRNLAIINTVNMDTKTLCTLPGEDLPHGGLVEWMDNKWLIIDRDANNELYTKGTMRQCNYLLRWIADDGNIIERWCIVEDGTKYLTGEYGDNQYILTRGDTRIAVTLPKDNYTLKLNRRNRFLIDDYNSPNVLAYELSKPFKLGKSYESGGILSFVMQECNTEDTDNLDLHIADYYKHFPREGTKQNCESTPNAPSEIEESTGKKVWY